MNKTFKTTIMRDDPFLLRNIASSPLLGSIAGLELRALRIEHRFLLKQAIWL